MRTRRGTVRVLLAALLAPVLLVAMPYTAQAATGYGSWVETVQTGQRGVSGVWADDIDCWFSARWTLSNDPTRATIELRNGTCSGLSLSASPGASVTFSGQEVGPGGAGCEYSQTFDPEDTGSWWDPFETLSYELDLIPNMGIVCDVTGWEVCTANGACAYGTIGLGTWQTLDIPQSTVGCTSTLSSFEVEIVQPSGWWVAADYGSATMHAQVFSETTQIVYVYYELWFRTTTGSNNPRPDGQWFFGPNGSPVVVNLVPGMNEVDLWTTTLDGYYGNDFTFYDLPNVNHRITIKGHSSNSDRFQDDGQNPTIYVADGQPACTYYFNRDGKFIDGASGGGGSESDPPPSGGGAGGGSSGDADTGTSQGCTFSWTDPGTWATGGICALVSLMQKVVGFLSTIARVIKGLVSSLLAGIQGLFVPRQSVISGHMTAMMADLEGSSPGQWSADTGAIFTELGAVGGGGTCEGPTLDVELGPAGFTMKPLNACGEPMSTVAGVVKLLLSLFSVVGGLFWAVHFIGSGLGMHNRLPTWDQGELF